MNTLKTIEDSILVIRGVPVILDSDVAAFYGVETKRINEAVRKNPEKFPLGYVVSLTDEEWADLKSKFLTSNDAEGCLRSKISTLDDEESETANQGRLRSKISTSSWGGKRYSPKAFTEQGLYMLATILKSPKATQTTLAIIETFTKMRELGRNVRELAETTTPADKKQLMEKTGEIITDIFADDLEPLESETTFELNFALLKFKHTVKKDRKKKKE